jgi:hypothetical protein
VTESAQKVAQGSVSAAPNTWHRVHIVREREREEERKGGREGERKGGREGGREGERKEGKSESVNKQRNEWLLAPSAS